MKMNLDLQDKPWSYQKNYSILADNYFPYVDGSAEMFETPIVVRNSAFKSTSLGPSLSGGSWARRDTKMTPQPLV